MDDMAASSPPQTTLRHVVVDEDVEVHLMVAAMEAVVETVVAAPLSTTTTEGHRHLATTLMVVVDKAQIVLRSPAKFVANSAIMHGTVGIVIVMIKKSAPQTSPHMELIPTGTWTAEQQTMSQVSWRR